MLILFILSPSNLHPPVIYFVLSPSLFSTNWVVSLDLFSGSVFSVWVLSDQTTSFPLPTASSLLHLGQASVQHLYIYLCIRTSSLSPKNKVKCVCPSICQFFYIHLSSKGRRGICCLSSIYCARGSVLPGKIASPTH